MAYLSIKLPPWLHLRARERGLPQDRADPQLKLGFGGVVLEGGMGYFRLDTSRIVPTWASFSKLPTLSL